MALPDGVNLDELIRSRIRQWAESRRPEGSRFVDQSQQGETPTPPIYAPNANSPTYDLKRRTAAAYHFSPEATAQMYQTPTKTYISNNPKIGDTVVGGFHQPTGPSSGRIETVNDPSVMAHEFGHNWEYTRLSPEQRSAWEETANIVLPTQAGVDLYNRYNNSPTRDEAAIEGYAHTIDAGAETIPPQWRESFFPGLFRQDTPYIPYGKNAYNIPAEHEIRHGSTYRPEMERRWSNQYPEYNQPPGMSNELKMRFDPASGMYKILSSSFHNIERPPDAWLESPFNQGYGYENHPGNPERNWPGIMFEDASWSGQSPEAWLTNQDYGPRTYWQEENYPESLPGQWQQELSVANPWTRPFYQLAYPMG